MRLGFFVRILVATIGGAIVCILSLSGQSDASHTVLRFPFQYGQSAEITFGYNASPTHVGGNKWAIDFKIAGGSTSAYAVASATGTVVARESGINGCSQTLGNGNYVDVQTTHPATQETLYARYAHLLYGSVVIQVGDPVWQGRILGQQGGTGWLEPCGSTLLHFRWASTQNCNASSNESCARLPEPMSGYTGFAAGLAYTSDNLDRPPVVEGTLFKSNAPGAADIYVAEGSVKRKINSATTFTQCGYQWSDIVLVNPTVLSLMGTGSVVTAKPCPGTLVQLSGNATVYVVEFGFRRAITSANLFNACGYSWSEIVTVTSWNGMLQGADLNLAPCPYVRHPWISDSLVNGSLPMSGATIYVTDFNQRHSIASPSLFESCGYRWNDPMPHAAVGWINTGLPENGVPCSYTLVQDTTGSIYFMSSNQKRWITSPAALEACGFAWQEIVFTSQSLSGITNGLQISGPPCPYARN